MAAQNIFAKVLDRVRAANDALVTAGELPAGIDQSRVVVEPPRDPTPWRHGDQCRHGAGQGRRQEAARSGRGHRRQAARRSADRQGGRGGAGLHQPDAEAGRLGEELRAVIDAGLDYGRGDVGNGEPVNVEYVSANPTGPMHVGHCRGAVFGDALANLLDFRRLQGHARILHQRCRRAGRCARPLGFPALPRGAGRGHRRDPGRALSRRLSEAGRRSARQGVRRFTRAKSRKASGCRSRAPRPSR